MDLWDILSENDAMKAVIERYKDSPLMTEPYPITRPIAMQDFLNQIAGAASTADHPIFAAYCNTCGHVVLTNCAVEIVRCDNGTHNITTGLFTADQ